MITLIRAGFHSLSVEEFDNIFGSMLLLGGEDELQEHFDFWKSEKTEEVDCYQTFAGCLTFCEVRSSRTYSYEVSTSMLVDAHAFFYTVLQGELTQKVGQLFEMFDFDHSGHISIDELNIMIMSFLRSNAY